MAPYLNCTASLGRLLVVLLVLLLLLPHGLPPPVQLVVEGGVEHEAEDAAAVGQGLAALALFCDELIHFHPLEKRKKYIFEIVIESLGFMV